MAVRKKRKRQNEERKLEIINEQAQRVVEKNAKKSSTSNAYNENRSDKVANSNSLKLSNANWVYDSLKSAIKVRHHSPKTLQAYKIWTHKFRKQSWSVPYSAGWFALRITRYDSAAAR